ncbi:MAG: branched-chain amino acid ABC transporter permease [Alphaproteobacteria bacterium]|nr:branched-chain amino acid ABC transporter permease [Alphaproteobacteria bacterium]
MQIVANILFLSTFYMSFSIGLALIFGVMRTINYSYGELFMLGAYGLFAAVTMMQGEVSNLLILLAAFVGASIVVGMLGGVIEKLLVQPLGDRSFSIFMATLGLSYVLQVVMVQSVGSVGRYVPPLFPGIVRFAGMIMPMQRLVVVIVTFGMIFGLWYLLMRTVTGRAIRAAAQNKTGATLQGISIERVAFTTMVIGCALAAMSGVMMGSVMSINPFMGSEAIWRAFIIIIVGGIGSIPGAVVAAFLFGALDTLLTSVGYGQFSPMMDALIMLLILAFRPNGLLGVKE